MFITMYIMLVKVIELVRFVDSQYLINHKKKKSIKYH